MHLLSILNAKVGFENTMGKPGFLSLVWKKIYLLYYKLKESIIVIGNQIRIILIYF